VRYFSREQKSVGDSVDMRSARDGAVDVELGEDVEFARSMFDADPVDMPNSVRPR